MFFRIAQVHVMLITMTHKHRLSLPLDAADANLLHLNPHNTSNSYRVLREG